MHGDPGEYALLFDGSCGLCRATVELLSCFPMRARVVLVDAADPRSFRAIRRFRRRRRCRACTW